MSNLDFVFVFLNFFAFSQTVSDLVIFFPNFVNHCFKINGECLIVKGQAVALLTDRASNVLVCWADPKHSIVGASLARLALTRSSLRIRCRGSSVTQTGIHTPPSWAWSSEIFFRLMNIFL